MGGWARRKSKVGVGMGESWQREREIERESDGWVGSAETAEGCFVTFNSIQIEDDPSTIASPTKTILFY